MIKIMLTSKMFLKLRHESYNLVTIVSHCNLQSVQLCVNYFIFILFYIAFALTLPLQQIDV